MPEQRLAKARSLYREYMDEFRAESARAAVFRELRQVFREQQERERSLRLAAEQERQITTDVPKDAFYA